MNKRLNKRTSRDVQTASAAAVAEFADAGFELHGHSEEILSTLNCDVTSRSAQSILRFVLCVLVLVVNSCGLAAHQRVPSCNRVEGLGPRLTCKSQADALTALSRELDTVDRTALSSDEKRLWLTRIGKEAARNQGHFLQAEAYFRLGELEESLQQPEAALLAYETSAIAAAHARAYELIGTALDGTRRVEPAATAARAERAERKRAEQARREDERRQRAEQDLARRRADAKRATTSAPAQVDAREVRSKKGLPETVSQDNIPELLRQLTSGDMVLGLLAQGQLIAIGKPALPALGNLCQRLAVLERQLRHADAALAAKTYHPGWEAQYQGRPVGVSRDLESTIRSRLLCSEAVQRIKAGER